MCELLSDTTYQIPKYQRGYSWEEEQHRQLIDDLNNIVQWMTRQTNNQFIYFMGTIISYKPQDEPKCAKEIVDGQQRLLSLSLYLAAMKRHLNDQATTEKIDALLFADQNMPKQPRIKLLEENDNIFYRELLDNNDSKKPESFSQHHLYSAFQIYHKHFSEQSQDKLIEKYNVIKNNLRFAYFEISEYAEAGMTFELVNNRGKELTHFELAKNYFIFWAHCNLNTGDEKRMIEQVQETYTAIYQKLTGKKDNIDSYLAAIFVLATGTTSYDGYKTIKSYYPINTQNPEEIKNKIQKFLTCLSKFSEIYKCITSPNEINGTTKHKFGELTAKEECRWLNKINHLGYIHNFIPLLLILRMKFLQEEISPEMYVRTLKALEIFIYQIYAIIKYRSDAFRPAFYRKAIELTKANQNTASNFLENSIIGYIVNECNNHSALYRTKLDGHEWFNDNLNYILYEFEEALHLSRYGSINSLQPWDQLIPQTSREHILPASTPDKLKNGTADPYWQTYWGHLDTNTIKTKYINDIGNFLLIHGKDNKVFQDAGYPRKCRGEGDTKPNPTAYNNQTMTLQAQWMDSAKQNKIKVITTNPQTGEDQIQELTYGWNDWKPEDAEERRNVLIGFIKKRWNHKLI